MNINSGKGLNHLLKGYEHLCFNVSYFVFFKAVYDIIALFILMYIISILRDMKNENMK